MAQPELENDDLEDSPQGYQERWQIELSAAHDELKKFHKRGDKIVKRFSDERGDKSDESRLNLFTSNVQTLRALLMGKTPQVDVGRKFADSQDDVARVAGEMMERALNSDIERETDTYETALQHALDDRLLPGLGVVRCRYVCEFEQQEVEPIHKKDAMGQPVLGDDGQPQVLAEGYTKDVKCSEDVEVDHVNWKDFRWSPARTWGEVRWVAFRVQMSRKQLVKRFGEDKGKVVPLNTKKRNGENSSIKHDPWARADVWEIHSKELGMWFWYVEGMEEILDAKEDPLKLEGFWAMPKPLLANVTTSSVVPTADFVLAQDQYDEIDTLTTRIKLLIKALKVSGVYNGSVPGLIRLINEDNENTLSPVDGWAMFAEKGGIKGNVDWLPIAEIAAALDKLCEKRNELISLLFQVTGMSDIMRGQAAAQATATEQAIKAKFASVRTQSMQDEFARFASETQRIKAEIISKHFEPDEIIKRSNVQFTADAQMAQQAVQLIKSSIYLYRIVVRPDAVALTDYAALKTERSEFIGGLSTFLTAAMPMAQALPGSVPYLLQLLQWSMAGFRGSSQVEGILDQAIAQAQQAAEAPPQPPPPDPKLQVEQVKAQNQAVHTKNELQADLIRNQAESAADQKAQASQFAFNQAEAIQHARLEAMKVANKPDAGDRPNG